MSVFTTHSNIESLRRLAGKREAWSLGRMMRRARKLVQMPVCAVEQRRVLCVLGSPAYESLLRAYPRTPYKYLEEKYLALGFSLRARAASLLCHYQSMLNYLPGEILEQLPAGETTLIEAPGDLCECRVTLGGHGLFQDEGELALRFRADGQELFILSFSVVPGWVLRMGSERAILIARLQGAPGLWETVQCATKALHDVAPAALLVAVLEGMGRAWGIDALAGVSASQQHSYDAKDPDALRHGYDGFLEQLLMQRDARGFYTSPLPLPLKPMSQIKQGHKIRTREKRAFKAWVSDRVTERLGEWRQEVLENERKELSSDPCLQTTA
ncbi:MAG: DUF535 family protein [Terracidiphilus sp.]|nr:DUF535 family protein [Terracidiphilus sp.]